MYKAIPYGIRFIHSTLNKNTKINFKKIFLFTKVFYYFRVMGKETILLTIREAHHLLNDIDSVLESGNDPVEQEKQLEALVGMLEPLINKITLTLPDYEFRERYKVPINKFYNLKKKNELKLHNNKVLDIPENVNKLS